MGVEEIKVEAVVLNPGILEVEVDQALVLQNVVVIILQVVARVIVLDQAVEVVVDQGMANHLGIMAVVMADHHGILVMEEVIMDHHGIMEAVTVTVTQMEIVTMDHLGIMIILTIKTTTIQEIPI